MFKLINPIAPSDLLCKSYRGVRSARNCESFVSFDTNSLRELTQDKRVSKFFLLGIFFVILFFNFCFSQGIDFVVTDKTKEFPELDFKRVEQKCLQFQKFANRSRNFRKVVYISSALAAVGLLTYVGIKFFGKQDKKEEEKSNVSLEKEKLNTLLSSLDQALKQKKDSYNLDFANLFKRGVSNGFYYGISGVVITSFLGMQAGLFNTVKNKFVELWNGQGEAIFLSVAKLLEVNIKQLDLFLNTWDLMDDEDELKENYSLFIDYFENLIALVTQGSFDLLSKKPTIQQSILNLRDILCANVVDFTDELQQFLYQDLTQGQGFERLDSVKISFERLGNQIGRFVKLYYSALYEA